MGFDADSTHNHVSSGRIRAVPRAFTLNEFSKPRAPDNEQIATTVKKYYFARLVSGFECQVKKQSLTLCQNYAYHLMNYQQI